MTPKRKDLNRPGKTGVDAQQFVALNAKRLLRVHPARNSVYSSIDM